MGNDAQPIPVEKSSIDFRDPEDNSLNNSVVYFILFCVLIYVCSERDQVHPFGVGFYFDV